MEESSEESCEESSSESSEDSASDTARRGTTEGASAVAPGSVAGTGKHGRSAATQKDKRQRRQGAIT